MNEWFWMNQNGAELVIVATQGSYSAFSMIMIMAEGCLFSKHHRVGDVWGFFSYCMYRFMKLYVRAPHHDHCQH